MNLIPPIYNLPTEILVNHILITDDLSPSDICNFSETNKNFAKLRKHPLIIRQILEHPSLAVNRIKFTCFVGPLAQELDLRNNTYNTNSKEKNILLDQDLEQIAQACPNLLSLNVSFRESITDQGIEKIAKSCSNLQSLNLAGCKKISSIGIHTIAQFCTQLFSANLSFCHPTNETLEFLAKSCSNLSVLDLIFSNINDDVLEKITLSGRIKAFDLSCCSELTERSLATLNQNCSLLVSLTLGSSTQWCHFSDKAMQELRLPKLEKLELAGFLNVTDKGFENFSQRYPTLQSITLKNFPEITNTSLRHFQYLSALQSIELQYCDRLTDEGVKFLICTHLKKLELQCRSLKDVGELENLIENCPQLESLRFWHTPSDSTLEKIARLTNLQALSLDCRNITAKGWQVLAKNCRELKSLSLSHSSTIKDEDLIMFIQNHPKLRQIGIDDFTNITSNVVTIIAQRCFNLESLSFACQEVKGDVDDLIKKCPSLRYLRGFKDTQELQEKYPKHYLS